MVKINDFVGLYVQERAVALGISPELLDEIQKEIMQSREVLDTVTISGEIRDRILSHNQAIESGLSLSRSQSNGVDDLYGLKSTELPIPEGKVSFRCNDNISAFIRPGELEELVDEVAVKMQGVLESLVIDTKNDHNTADTARRVAKMMIMETFGGRYSTPPKPTAFPNMGYDGLYTAGPISIKSTCAHHFQNIVGKCWVGVIPGEKVIGLSKFNRVVHHIAHRPQIQEEMTMQIAEELMKLTESPDIAVVVKAEHHCMTHRGVREHESDMVTTQLRGKFKELDGLRAEFYNIIQNLKSY
jgi:GTP cyclohydrolase IA